ncbi:hypothetical protein C8A00DRAFT_34800 [Chaetomidium leptoderma]|uniref:Uncharacterized protein n=1 Tax=Chaetomidium leptoderma TaxID=669021 RepID=A0AAN6VKI6_9PEZI|nr:hypothetical protein C8A00DRAFT_34800 [Chaetomidium leptoderma]
MAARFDSGLEPARQDYPEVTHVQQGYGHQQYQQHQQQYPQHQPQPYSDYPQPYDPSATTPKPEPPASPPSTFSGQTVASPFSAHAHPVAEPPQPKPTAARTICGYSLLVVVLSCIIALLSAAVIGLAAATGIESQRATSAASSLAAVMSASTTATGAPTATPTVVGVIDDGCSDDPDGVNKTLYTSFSLLGGLKFTRYCNRDAPNAPLLSLFAANFGTCMDACAAYTKYVPGTFGNTANATCGAVSFIPAWANKITASNGGAPGNCYLKGGPQNESALTTPNIGVDCHAAIFTPGA